MWLLLVEAVGAMLILVFIVWWTMFCGRGPQRRDHNEEPSGKYGHADRDLHQKDDRNGTD